MKTFNPHHSDFTDCYFNKSKKSLVGAGHNPRVVYQVFQKNEATMCGIELIKPLFDNCCDTVISSLMDGDVVHPFEAVMHIEAPVQELVDLETTYLGIIARCTRVATNVRKTVVAAKRRPVLFFPARFDVPEVQYYDGYAARIGGAVGCSTVAQMEGFNNNLTPPVGTMPHALIAAFGGDTATATLAFAFAHPNQDIWSLVDFENDCAKTAVEVYNKLKTAGFKLKGVRLDTSEKNIDNGVYDKFKPGTAGLYGVCPELVRHVRQTLDTADACEVEICVSGGFTPEKVAKFESEGVPVDVYAVGESTIKGANPFTSDIVRINQAGEWKDIAKVGRGFSANNRLVTWTS